jgi:hypothetical protein
MWKKEHRDYCRQYDKKRRREHPEYRILRKIVHRMVRASCVRKGSRSDLYVGCTPGFLRNHLETMFKHGMTWNNYGTVWQVDHVIPLAWWDLKNHPEHMFEASHWTNLQPLFINENQSKGARHVA